MSADERIQRDHFVVNQVFMLPDDLYPVHVAGMSLFCYNASEYHESAIPPTPEASVLSIQDSPDGTTWSAVTFSVGGEAPVLTHTIQPGGKSVLLFTSQEKYVRISLAANNEAGVYVDAVQYPDKTRVPATEY